ncbi:transmembrane protein 120A [Biomphalaria pfeifferi]|uniref:Transmembrane protein 120A n=1 Tax=Biomphalaria pfeifferi TaxID=112525 RepID=A0AAD8FL44_BIOPF|nr:transmembrane protein 120A [Biomphalaria pfeifferi]
MSRESTPNILLLAAMEDWNDLEKEYVQLEEEHKNYCDLLAKLSAAQKKCLAQIAHHRYRMKCIGDNITRATKGSVGEDEKKQANDLKHKMAERKLNFHEMEENLPHKNGLYLRIILGQVNVSLLTKEAKFIYKKDYETFKLTVSYIILALSFVAAFVISSRVSDAVVNFLLVWYYCTLTIRESILRVNGSRIKGWWVTHHFISTVCAAISLIWPDGYTYSQFRYQYILFVMYISFVYVLQYYYQSGCLYRLRSLGESHEMDITVEGFMSWMWKGLTFLLPVLFFGYFFQLYNAYSLLMLASHPKCTEWQVFALSAIHFILFVGNTMTTCTVLFNKIKSDGFRIPKLRNKYKFSIGIGNFLSQGHGHAE